MNTTEHSVAPEDVMALLDGELSAAEAQAVSAHLAECVGCSNLAERFQATSHTLSRWTVPNTPPSLDDSVRDMIADAGSQFRVAKPNSRIRINFWSWKPWAIASGGAVAGVVLLLATTASLWYRADTPRSALKSERVSNYIESQPEDRAASHMKSPPGVAGLVTEPSPTPMSEAIRPMQQGMSKGVNRIAQDTPGASPAPMIARTVSLAIVVKDFSASRILLDRILAQHRGYSAQLNVSTPENAARSFHASLRIPARELDSAIENLKALGHVENESQAGEEVTPQHADLVARLKTSRESEERLRAILQQRTGKVSDVLEVEEEIARVRGEIESTEAEQKALEHRVDFASVDLQLTEEYQAQLNSPSATSTSTRVHNAFVAGYREASETLLTIVLFFCEYGLSLLIWLAILGLPLTLLRRRYLKMRSRI